MIHVFKDRISGKADNLSIVKNLNVVCLPYIISSQIDMESHILNYITKIQETR